MAELEDVLLGFDNSGVTHTVKVEVDMLDFDYVAKCKNVSTLKAILKVLISGKEGRYLSLEKTVEEKIFSLLPEKQKKRIMSLKSKVTLGDIKYGKDNLNDWVENIKKTSARCVCESNDVPYTLETDKIFDTTMPAKSKKDNFPPVRASKKCIAVEASRNMPSDRSSRNFKAKPTETRICKDTVSNKDYFQAWDRFDVDAAERAVEEEGRSVQDTSSPMKIALEDKAARERTRGEAVLERIREALSYQTLTDTERMHIASREKDKGNEYFKSNEYEEAVTCYSNSLALDNINPIVYANRAMASIRLTNFNQAIADCTEALRLDPMYTKALARRGIIHHKCGRFLEARDDFKLCLVREPENKEYAQMLKRSSEKHIESSGGDDVHQTRKKILIQDYASDEENELQNTESGEDEDVEEFFTPGALRATRDEMMSATSDCMNTVKPSRDERSAALNIRIIESNDSDSDDCSNPKTCTSSYPI